MFRKSTIRRRQFDGRVVGLAVLALAARAHADGESRAVASTGGAAATGPVSCKAFVGPDADQDCDVDLSDFRLFQACVTGPDAGPPIPECQGMDIDGDGDVDPADAAVFSQCRGGPGLVAEAACEEPGYVPPTSLAKIDEELAAGLITETDALRYKVFAVYGDGRLPHRFGGATFEEGTAVVEQLAEQYGDLPVELRDELTPFVLPPDAPGSWYAASAAAGSTSSAASDGPPTGSFHQLDVTDGAGKSVAVVKWPTTHALAPSAQIVRDAMQGPDGVYAKLVALMGRAPRSDADLDPEYNGGDGRYDVFLLPTGSTNFGWTQPASPGFFQGVFFDRTRTSFIVMDVQTIANNFGGQGTALYNRKLRSNIAHEFMHAIQFAFDLAGSRSEYWWLGDATATWAEHYVFPSENMEHPDAPDYLRTLHVPWRSITGTGAMVAIFTSFTKSRSTARAFCGSRTRARKPGTRSPPSITACPTALRRIGRTSRRPTGTIRRSVRAALRTTITNRPTGSRTVRPISRRSRRRGCPDSRTSLNLRFPATDFSRSARSTSTSSCRTRISAR